MRIAMGLAYDGTRYHGWQSQGTLLTVQSQIEQALSKMANHPVHVTASGRTDQGVHAATQVLHFDTTTERTERNWILGSNDYLPPDIRVLWIKQVALHFHARFSAIARHYRYIINQQNVPLPWLRHYSLWLCQPLDIEAMQQASNALIGEHDFSTFRASSCQSKSAIRRITQLTITHQPPWVWVNITANAFLHHMVRNIVGVLIEIGKKKRAASTMIELLESRNRQKAAATARAHGLYLQHVDYPEEFALPYHPMNQESVTS